MLHELDLAALQGEHEFAASPRHSVMFKTKGREAKVIVYIANTEAADLWSLETAVKNTHPSKLENENWDRTTQSRE